MDTELILAGDPVSTVLIVGSLLISAAMILTAKKPKAAPLDDAMQQSATRGAYIPLVIGRQRVGHVFAWVQDLTTDGDSLVNYGRGKGAGGPPPTSDYVEAGLHLLAVGPGSALYAIYQNNEIIWESPEPLTPQTHPSGTQLNLTNGDIFNIFWGFPDDPDILAPDGSPSVNFPMCLKIFWRRKILGQSRQWPRMEYEIECPCYSQITSTRAELPLLYADPGPTFAKLETVHQYPNLIQMNSGSPGFSAYQSTDPAEFFVVGCSSSGDILVINNKSFYTTNITPTLTTYTIPPLVFQPGSVIKIFSPDETAASNGVAQGQPSWAAWNSSLDAILDGNNQWRVCRVAQSEQLTMPFLHPTFGAIQLPVTRLRIDPVNDLTAAVSELTEEIPAGRTVNTSISMQQSNGAGSLFPRLRIGFVRLLSADYTSVGVNPIHMIDQVLFARYPHGCGRNRKLFDPQSIENAAAQLETELVRGSLIVKDGETVSSVLAAVMQDIGLFISWDVTLGRYVFKLIRYADPNTAPDLPEHMVLEQPSMEMRAGDRPANIVAFTFRDRSRNYREEPLVWMDSGQVQRYQSQRAKKVPIEVTNDYDSAARLVARRQQEAFADNAALTWKMNHAAIRATPGEIFKCSTVEDPELVFRITSVKPSINSSSVEVATVVDTYSSPPLGLEDSSPGLVRGPTLLGEEDLLPAAVAGLEAFRAFQIPPSVAGSTRALAFLAARSGGTTEQAEVWMSWDGGTSYSMVGKAMLAASGILDDALDAVETAGPYAASSCSFDFGRLAVDFSIDTGSWTAGRQLLLVDNEVIYLRSAYDLGNGNGEFEGLIRGQLGTVAAPHSAGARFWLLSLSSAELYRELPIQSPVTTVHVKMQAVERGAAEPLEGIAGQAVSLT